MTTNDNRHSTRISFHLRILHAAIRIAGAALLLTSFASGQVAAQTVLVETNVADFEMELNPTKNPNLQGHIENFLQYLEQGVYEGNVINRAVDDFVLQMGNFELDPPLLSNLRSAGFDQTFAFDPVVVDANMDGVVDFDTTGLSNVRGEVALAISSANLNSGSNSFYINLSDNSFLDAQGFVPFARIIDMTPVEEIMAVPTVDLTDIFGTRNLAYSDIPVINGESLVVIERVSIVPEAATSTLGLLASITCVSVRNRREGEESTIRTSLGHAVRAAT